MEQNTLEQEKQKLVAIAEKFRDSAFPVTVDLQYATRPDMSYRATSKGLSKREYIATEAMKAYQSRNGLNGSTAEHPEVIARRAVEQADYLMAALNKVKS